MLGSCRCKDGSVETQWAYLIKNGMFLGARRLQESLTMIRSHRRKAGSLERQWYLRHLERHDLDVSKLIVPPPWHVNNCEKGTGEGAGREDHN
jgi:hypothetical protein